MSRTSVKTILIVDDNHDAADSLALLIELKGHKALIAYDAETGLELAYAESPDIIVHDINLPLMNGYVAARKIREQANCATTILIALTAYASPADRERALSEGFDFHMSKPLDFEELDRILDQAASPSGAGQTAKRSARA